MNSQSYHVLHIIFIKPISNQTIIEVKNDFFNISISVIYLSFSCNHQMEDTNWFEYIIKPANHTYRKTRSCPTQRSKSSTTKSM